MKRSNKCNSTGESLTVCGRPYERSQNGNKGKSRRDKWWKKVKCYIYQEIRHTKRFCPKKNKKGKEQEEAKGEVAMAQEGHDSAKILIVIATEVDKRWIMDSGCSFHMTPNKDWFETLSEAPGGQVILENNKSCEVMGIGSVRIKMHDGVERVLQEVKYISQV